VILDQDEPSVKFSTGALESGLICMSGECTIKAAGETNNIGQYDSIYLPRDTEVEITTGSAVDLVECSAEVENKYPLQVVRYADVEKDGSLKFKTGGASNSRTVNITLGKNVEAGRILAGLRPLSRATGPVGRRMNTLRSSKSFTFITTCRRPHSACNLSTRTGRTGVYRRGARWRRGDHAEGFSSERLCPRPPDQLCLDDGGASRS